MENGPVHVDELDGLAGRRSVAQEHQAGGLDRRHELELEVVVRLGVAGPVSAGQPDLRGQGQDEECSIVAGVGAAAVEEIDVDRG